MARKLSRASSKRYAWTQYVVRIEEAVKQTTNEPRTFDELIPLIRQKRLQTPQRLSRIVRTLVRFHDPLSRWLVTTRVSAIQLTVAWFLFSLASFAASAYGAPWGFVLGSLLLYGAIIIDLCDGEVGRYRSLSMTAEEDLRDHINGMYLDRVFHFVSSQLWPLAIGLGLYRMHGSYAALAASIPILLTINVHRLKPYLMAYMRDVDDRGHINDWLIVRAGWWIGALIRNGKRSNYVVLLAGIADCVLWFAIGPHAAQAVHILFVAAGAAALVIEASTLLGFIHMNTAVLGVRDLFLHHNQTIPGGLEDEIPLDDSLTEQSPVEQQP